MKSLNLFWQGYHSKKTSSFPTMFSKGFYTRSLKGGCGKGLTLNKISPGFHDLAEEAF